MSKYNATKTVETVKSHEGGASIKFSKELELISLLADGMGNTFYEKENDRETRLIGLIRDLGKKNPEFVAKALVYARAVMGQRSVTHVGAVAAASVLSGNPIGSRFYSKRDRKENRGGVIYRLDDMLEMVSYYQMRNPGKALPNALKRGFRAALESADAYELAKYQGKNKNVSLVDIVNLVHPHPAKAMEATFKALMNGELKQFNTAEDKMTDAGQKVAKLVKSGEITKDEAEKVLKEAKDENWKELITNGTIGYLALLRNLRNIVTVDNLDVFKAGLERLTDEKAIRKSLVFPHQIDIAFEVLLSENIPHGRKSQLLTAVNRAYELSIPNLTELFTHGRTAVVFDSSGSMSSQISNGKTGRDSKAMYTSAIEKAALIGATLAKATGADLYHFANYTERIDFNPIDSVNTIKNVGLTRQGAVGYGTEFHTIFDKLEGKYDRVFVISDMQGADSILRGSSYQTYIKKYGQPYVYSINLCGYGTTMFKQSDKLINLFGYSSDIYEMIKKAEIDPKVILKEIEAINI